jgi:hypothetical protein
MTATKIRDTLQRDPATHPLANQGQARIADRPDEKVVAELRAELSTFVCEGQFADGIHRIVQSYLANSGHTSQKAAWVSGFFGSGKSHLLKMLAHLWSNTEFADGATARSMVTHMPDDLRALFRELDTAGKREGGLLAAAGALPSGSTDFVRHTILGVLLRAADLPDQYPQARFCLWLHDQGYYDAVKGAVERSGKQWMAELNNLYVSGLIAKAVLDCDPKFAPDEAEARKTMREQFAKLATDIDTRQFLDVFSRVLKLKGRNGRLPCTILILDEAQQYIGDSPDRSTIFTEVVEAVSKQLDSRVMVVAAGQSALTEVPLLQKLMDRFTIRVPLSDADVETVTRKVLLQKKPSAVKEVRRFLDTHAGEISRQLQGTAIGEVPEDQEIIVEDYPLLPVRRRFWEHCFRVVDAAGTHSQLRSQLRIIHDAVKRVADDPLGRLIPGDELYDALAPEMVNTGVLLRELNERIIKLGQGGGKAQLARRIAGLVFLIGRLPREAGASLGVQSTKEHLADLLVDDLQADNGKLRSQVGAMLEKLAEDGVLMRVGEEYRLQTREGQQWDQEFRNRQSKLTGDSAEQALKRDPLLYAEIEKVIRQVKVAQGEAREPRQLLIHRGEEAPAVSGEAIPLWVRDGWAGSEKAMVDAMRGLGTDSPIVSVFIPKRSADDFAKCMIEAEARDQTVNGKGIPSTPEGMEARRSMESLRDLAMRKRDVLVREIVDASKVYQGGGNELLQLTLQDKLREAAEAALVRLFPRFKEADADARKWEAVIKRAREGADQPFQPVGHTGKTEDHPVCRQVISTIGSGKTGTEIRKTLRTAPFGWPQDAVDAALMALQRLEHVDATLNGEVVPPGQLDQGKIPKAEFRIARSPLSTQDKIVLRGLFQKAGVSCKAGEEAEKSRDFVAALLSLAREIGGDPPLPTRPSTADLEEVDRLLGNDRLAALRGMKDSLDQRIAEWSEERRLLERRWPVWQLVQRLAQQARDISEASGALGEVEAIRTGRLLLEQTDHVAPLRAALASALRVALASAVDAHTAAHRAGLALLERTEIWKRLSKEVRESILAQVQLRAPQAPDVSTDEALVGELERASLATRRAEADAVAGRLSMALELAAKHLEPRVQLIRAETAILRTRDDVKAWLASMEKVLLKAVEQGPVHLQ